MEQAVFRLSLYLPAQGASETEATLVRWYVAEGDRFTRGQALAQVDSAKSVFDFEAPCDGRVLRRPFAAGDVVAYDQPVLEIETADAAMRDWIPPAAADSPAPAAAMKESGAAPALARLDGGDVVLLGFGAYLPERVVTNAELIARFPDVSQEYVHQVTGISERHWAAEDEKPSDMACEAAREAIRRSGIASEEIDAVVLATTTPDVAMPSTACIVQQRLGLEGAAAFDLNAACSGWLYAVSMAQGMVLSGVARNVLTIGADLQSRLLNQEDRSAIFLFGDGAGAAVVSRGRAGHAIRQVVLGADTRGLHAARRHQPGYSVSNGRGDADPWIRMDGPSLFRLAAESFAHVIRRTVERTGWSADQLRWIVPHQANHRLLRAAAKRSGTPLERFFVNIEHVGNTSAASIPLALAQMADGLRPGDKLLLCSVGAGLTTAAVAVEW